MNKAVWDALVDLVKDTQVIHMTGEPAYADALKVREKLPTGWRSRYKPYPFLRSEMTDALVASDMLVGRAGSSTLAEASAPDRIARLPGFLPGDCIGVGR